MNVNQKIARPVTGALIAALVFGGFVAGAQGVGRDKEQIANPPKDVTAAEALENFAVNYTKLAKAGAFEKFYGEGELKRNLRELRLGHFKSAMILGPRGAGKTSFMQQIAGELGPGEEIWSLNVQDLESGTKYRGDLEQRFKAFCENFEQNPKRILFIDEFHRVMGITGIPDAIKTLMNNHKVTVYGGTTEDEFRLVEKDEALADRFSGATFRMENADLQKVIEILRLKADDLEEKYQIFIRDEAIERTAKLTFLYYAENSPSRTAQRILNRAAARKALNLIEGDYSTVKPKDKMEISAKNLARFEAELDKDQKDNEEGKFGAIDTTAIERKIDDEQQRYATFKSELAKANDITRRDVLNNKLSLLVKQRREMEADVEAQKHPDFQQLHREMSDSIQRTQDKLVSLGNGGPKLNAATLSGDDIGQFVASEVGITSEVANETDYQKIKRLETKLRENLFGQDHVIKAVVDAVRRRLARIDKINGPVLVMLAAGGKGTGKTTLQKILAEVWYGSPSRVVSIAMNGENPGDTWSFFGSGKGYKDTDEGGKLDPLRRRAHSLLALMEADKIDGRVYDMLHQALDEGEQKDSRGRTINFRHAMVILDGNFTESISELLKHHSVEDIERSLELAPGTLRGLTPDEMNALLLKRSLDRHGISESIQDRFTAQVVFNQTTMATAKQIMRKKLKDQADEIFDNHQVSVDFGDVGDVLIDHTFDADYSARAYERVRDRKISDSLAHLFTEVAKLPPRSVVKVGFVATSTPTADGPAGHLEFTVTHPQPKMVAGKVVTENEVTTFSRVELFMQANHKPTLALGRTTGDAGRFGRDADGKTRDRERSDRPRGISTWERFRSRAPAPKGRP